MVYALLPNKTEVSYVLFFNLLTGYIRVPPRSIMTDFEKAALNALRKSFKDASIQGCYYHLVSNLWKHVVNEGLKKFYSENKQFRTNFKYLKALAFIPVKDVVYAFKLVKSNSIMEVLPILKYFVNYYIGKLVNEKRQFSQLIYGMSIKE